MSTRDYRTCETSGETMGICTANSRTANNSSARRRQLALSVFNTSFQLCSSVHLRVDCRADQSFFVEDDHLYIDCQEQRHFCMRSVVNRYLVCNQTLRSADRLKFKIVSDSDMMTATFPMQKLCCIGPGDSYRHSICCCKVTRNCLPPQSTFFISWAWQPCEALLHIVLNRTLPGLCSFGFFSKYPYAWFLMACFQQRFSRSVACTHRDVNQQCSRFSSVSDTCNMVGTESVECKPSVSCQSSAGYHCETETSYDVQNDFNGASSLQQRNSSMNVVDSENTSGCSATVPNHIIPAKVADDGDGNDRQSQEAIPLGANCMTDAPFSGATETGKCVIKNQTKSSFFVRASNSSDSDDDDDDNNCDTDADSDDEFDCWDDDCDDNSDWTTHADTTQCFLLDLDPFKISGLYIPQTSIVPVSQSQCLSLLVDSVAAEIEPESMSVLQRVNDTWRQCYCNDATVKPLSRHRHHTKHVCIFTEAPKRHREKILTLLLSRV